MSKQRVNTPGEVRAQFDRIGKPLTTWARENGYSPRLVFEILGGRVRGKRGKAHEIAVKLGLKIGEIVSQSNPESDSASSTGNNRSRVRESTLPSARA